jgi:hypothetical protein
MTGARAKHNHQERQIAKALGLTDAQLDGLLRIKAGYWPGTAAAVLEAKGLAFRERRTITNPSGYGEREIDTGKSGLTEAGLAMLDRARAMGF